MIELMYYKWYQLRKVRQSRLAEKHQRKKAKLKADHLAFVNEHPASERWRRRSGWLGESL